MNYLVERRGKSMCDSEVVAPVRRWPDQYLKNEDALADTEAAVADILNDYVCCEEVQNPHGLRYLTKVFSPKTLRSRRITCLELLRRQHDYQDPCWEAEPLNNASYPVAIFICLFSTSTSQKKAD